MELIGFNKETKKIHFIGMTSVCAWSWGKQLKNYIFYTVDESGINAIDLHGETNAMNIQMVIDSLNEEPCKG